MKKIKVYTAFGTDLVMAVANHKLDTIEAEIPYPQSFRVREFSTEAEAKAYIQGLDDSCGWLENSVLSPLDPFEKTIIQKIDKRNA